MHGSGVIEGRDLLLQRLDDWRAAMAGVATPQPGHGVE
jgi:hypothetical protein